MPDFDPSKYPALRCNLDELPDVSDIRPETVTEKVKEMNSRCTDPRLKFVLDNLVTHLHDFIRETAVTTEEWRASIEFLTAVGQKCSDVRQEFILLSDVFGVSALVDTINHPVVNGSTAATLLGPFYTLESGEIEHGGSIVSGDKGEPLLVEGRILSTSGDPIPNALIETWECDADGLYDVQYKNYETPDYRGRLRSNEKGEYSFRCIAPIPYGIPDDGPVGELLTTLKRHPYRPAHLHMKIDGPEEYEPLVTALYPRGDPFAKSDAVFGVKESLIVDFKTITSNDEAKAKGFAKAPFQLLEFDFVLPTKVEAEGARQKLREAGASKS